MCNSLPTFKEGLQIPLRKHIVSFGVILPGFKPLFSYMLVKQTWLKAISLCLSVLFFQMDSKAVPASYGYKRDY